MIDPGRTLEVLAPVLSQLRRGIEKEGLRVRPDGKLSATPHPVALGAALTHPRITTDFSESQLELITAVHTDADNCLRELAELHRFVYRNIGDEIVWAASMPCALPRESEIPIAQYGRSNVAQAKTVYRTGLSHRYGRRMQLISGIHYNFSLPDAVWPVAGLGDANSGYMALIRNFRRHAWLLLYLFGASPAVCACFVEGRSHSLRQLSADALFLPYATSLRMGRIGYLGKAQEALAVSCNDLESYAASLEAGLTKIHPAYEAIGVRDGTGYRQLATTLLQIENEYYATIRPKRIIHIGERPLHALRQRGIQYVEVRVMDVDPFARVGITADTARFLDVFLLHCLTSASPPDTPEEIRANSRNAQLVAERGREPGLRLRQGARRVGMRAWARRLLAECAPMARALDGACGGHAHAAALDAAHKSLEDPASLPSARVLAAIRNDYRGSWFAFALAQSRQHAAAMRSEPISTQAAARLETLARESVEEQRRLEEADTVPFETYLRQYLALESIAA